MSVRARYWCAVLCMLTALVAACGPYAPNVPPQGKPQTKIRFVTDWKAQAEHGGFYQAIATGIYKRHGLDVRLRRSWCILEGAGCHTSHNGRHL